MERTSTSLLFLLSLLIIFASGIDVLYIYLLVLYILYIPFNCYVFVHSIFSLTVKIIIKNIILRSE